MNPFPEKGLRSIRIISHALPFPIAIACYTETDEELVIGMESIIERMGYDYDDILTWCKDKGLLCYPYRDRVKVSFRLQ